MSWGAHARRQPPLNPRQQAQATKDIAEAMKDIHDAGEAE